MNHDQRVAHGFAKAAKGYDAYATLQRRVAKQLWEHLLQARPLKQTDTVLDLGCGTGYLQSLLQEQTLFPTVVGLDIAYAMCESAQKYYPTIQATMEQLPFQHNTIDVVFSSLALQWGENPTRVFSQLRNIVKPASVMAFSTLGQGTLCELSKAFSAHGLKPSVNNFTTKETLTQQLKHADFKNIQVVEECITTHYKAPHELMRYLKGIGASYKGKQSYIGRQKLQDVTDYYQQHYSSEDGVKATWNVVYLIVYTGEEG